MPTSVSRSTTDNYRRVATAAGKAGSATGTYRSAPDLSQETSGVLLHGCCVGVADRGGLLPVRCRGMMLLRRLSAERPCGASGACLAAAGRGGWLCDMFRMQDGLAGSRRPPDAFCCSSWLTLRLAFACFRTGGKERTGRTEARTEINRRSLVGDTENWLYLYLTA